VDTLTSTLTVVDRPDLATLRLAGADVLRYLHAVSTQHTLDLRPGDASQALLLSPKGRIEFAFGLAVLDDGVLLDTDTDAPALAERLARFVFRHDVTVGPPLPGAASLVGPRAGEALAAAGLPVPGPGEAAAAGAGLVVRPSAVGVDLLGPGAPAAAAVLEDTGVARGPAAS